MIRHRPKAMSGKDDARKRRARILTAWRALWRLLTDADLWRDYYLRAMAEHQTPSEEEMARMDKAHAAYLSRRDKLLAIQRRYYQRHRDEVLRKARERREHGKCKR